LLDRLDLLRRFEQIRAPPGQNRRDLVVVLFSDEIVEARRRLEERGIERRLRAIARKQVKFGMRRARALSAELAGKRKAA
jgi:hypothetical protein